MDPSRSTDPTGSPRAPVLPPVGTAAGHAIRTALPFLTLRSGGGTPLDVIELDGPPQAGRVLRSWSARPDHPFAARLHEAGEGTALWTSDAGWFAIDPAVPAIAVTPDVDPLRRELRLFGIPAAMCALARGDSTIHASAVEIDGQAVLFAGPGGHGKTTLAGAFAQAGHRLLSEDAARCHAGPTPTMAPGPAIIRLRADVADGLSIPAARGLDIEGDRQPFVIDADARGSGAPVPIRAIVLLRPEAPIDLRPVPPTVAVRDLLALTFALATPAGHAAAFASIADLVASVEVLELRRPFTADGRRATVDLVDRWLQIR
jgi:hypothetical protein